MAQMKIEEEEEYQMLDYSWGRFVWIEEINSKTSRKGKYYKSATSITKSVTFDYLFARSASGTL